MCSQEEAIDRQRFNELSLLESTNFSASVSKAHPKERIPHPKRCVKKYRRSAAGGGVTGIGDRDGMDSRDGRDGMGEAATGTIRRRRNIHDLEVTVNYLLGIIFCTQSSAPSTKSKDKDAFRVSLLQSVLFVDDRIRAVQVDLTTLLGETTTTTDNSHNHDYTSIRSVRQIQARILRYHLLSQYLLSNLSSKKYEWKFGHKALTTAISSYLATWNSTEQELKCDRVHGDGDGDSDDEDIAQLDEVISYITLLHVASILNSGEPSIQPYTSTTSQHKFCGLSCEDGHGMAAILGLFRKYCPKNKRERGVGMGRRKTETETKTALTLASFPKYQWSLKIASDVENGNYLSLIRFFMTSPDSPKNSMNDDSRWKIIARCCVAQVMPVIRIGLLRLYNKSFMKQEKVKDYDVSTTIGSIIHLLYIINFCLCGGILMIYKDVL